MIELAVAALATWRISVWLWYENGGQGVRALICRWPWAAQQVSCLWCVSLWVGLVCALIAWLWWYALIPFALSGAAILLSGGGRIIWKETVSDG